MNDEKQIPKTSKSRTRLELVIVMALAGLVANVQPLFGTDLDQVEFEKLHSALVPKEEAWKTIPWQTDLLTAQQMAAEQEKLIFIWSMDGHPLGCT